jgi:hypothetical protein
VSGFKWIGGSGPDPGWPNWLPKRKTEEISCFKVLSKGLEASPESCTLFLYIKEESYNIFYLKLLLMGGFLLGSETMHIITVQYFGKTFIT